MYDQKYYTTGNYNNYLCRKFDRLAHELITELSIAPSDVIVDYGCAYGGLLASLYQFGMIYVYGTDISEWAIAYGKESYPYISDRLLVNDKDVLLKHKSFVFFLDVLEHMPFENIQLCLQLAKINLSKILVARIPVSAKEGELFVLPVSNNDYTHIACHTRDWWLGLFSRLGYDFLGDLECETIYSSDGVLSGKWKPREM